MHVYNAYKHTVQTLVLAIQGPLFMHVYNAYKHIVQTLVLVIQGHYSCMYIMHIST